MPQALHDSYAHAAEKSKLCTLDDERVLPSRCAQRLDEPKKRQAVL